MGVNQLNANQANDKESGGRIVDGKILLTDAEMAQFITYGYLKLSTTFAPEFHTAVLEKMNEVYASEGNPGNNLLPRIPEVGQFFDHPVVAGALTSILGPSYMMSAHRHGHITPAGGGNIGWHKDNYWLNEKIRNNRPWSALIFYYTQDVTDEMGPSAVMPGSQYYYTRNGEDKEFRLNVTGKAGSMALIDYNTWHTASHNFSNIDRYMLKFQFFRFDAPQSPTWDHQDREFQPDTSIYPVNDHHRTWNHVWNWMLADGSVVGSGVGASTDAVGSNGVADAGSDTGKSDQVSQWLRMLKEGAEPEALYAAYELAECGEPGIAALLEALHAGSAASAESAKHDSPAHATACHAAHGLVAAGEPALPALLKALSADNADLKARGYIAFALGEFGPAAAAAVPALIALLQDETAFVRQHAAEALGLIQQPADAVVPALCQVLLHDPADFIRWTAGLALARLGAAAGNAAVPALRQALGDAYRYVPAAAVEALARIRTEEALDVLLPYLISARWCPATTKSSTF